MYEIEAKIAEGDLSGVGCFDPTKVVSRIRDEIPGVTVCIHDYAWDAYDAFVSRAAVEGAIRCAESDARRRGPIFVFRVRTGTNQLVEGSVERYRVRISSEQPIPQPIKSQFIELLESFKLGAVDVRSVRIVGNDVKVT